MMSRPMSVRSKQDQAPCALVESDVDLPEAASQAPAAGDARAFPRFSFRGRATALVFPPQAGPNAEPQEFEVITTDVSRGGLNLLHRKQLFPGQQIRLVLNSTSRLLEVCWCCRVWAGLFSAGCRFIDQSPMPAEEA
jgi:hypothetical protein